MTIGLLIAVIAMTWLGLLAMYWRSRKLQKLVDEKGYLAHHDFVTGLANRHQLTERIALEIKRVNRYKGRKLALLFIDLDLFKKINDKHGHDVGDTFLKAFGDVLQKCVRSVDLVARYGGDEFIVLLTDIRSRDDIVAVVEKIRDKIEDPIVIEGNSLTAGCTIGISVYPGTTYITNNILREADIAMYEAKRSQRGSYKFYEA